MIADFEMVLDPVYLERIFRKMPQRTGRAIAYAFLIWITGSVWGSVVFMTPSLKNISSIPYVSRYPAISFPVLIKPL
jgi:hypothetical protein